MKSGKVRSPIDQQLPIVLLIEVIFGKKTRQTREEEKDRKRIQSIQKAQCAMGGLPHHVRV